MTMIRSEVEEGCQGRMEMSDEISDNKKIGRKEERKKRLRKDGDNCGNN